MISCYDLIIFPYSTCNITSIGIGLLPNCLFTCSSNIVISRITCPLTSISIYSISCIMSISRLIGTTCTAISYSTICCIRSNFTCCTGSSYLLKSCFTAKVTIIIFTITSPISLICDRRTGFTVSIFHSIWSRISHMKSYTTSIVSVIKRSCMLIYPRMINPSSMIIIHTTRPYLMKQSCPVSYYWLPWKLHRTRYCARCMFWRCRLCTCCTKSFSLSIKCKWNPSWSIISTDSLLSIFLNYGMYTCNIYIRNFRKLIYFIER